MGDKLKAEACLLKRLGVLQDKDAKKVNDAIDEARKRPRKRALPSTAAA